MDTLPDDLLILVANVIDNLPDAELVFPLHAKYIQASIDKYMKSSYERIMNNLSRFISPEILEFIIQHNLTISGSFVLALICNAYWWAGDLDIICKEEPSTNIKERLYLKENYYSNFYTEIDGVHCLLTNKDYASIQNKDEKPTLIDVIVLAEDCSADDLLKEYDFDFVKNSLEFLPNGTARLTIKNPAAVWDRRCHVNVNCYGIMFARDKPSIEARINRLASRVGKYRTRGFDIKCDRQDLDRLIKHMRPYGIRLPPFITTYIPNYRYQLEDLHGLFNS